MTTIDDPPVIIRRPPDPAPAAASVPAADRRGPDSSSAATAGALMRATTALLRPLNAWNRRRRGRAAGLTTPARVAGLVLSTAEAAHVRAAVNALTVPVRTPALALPLLAGFGLLFLACDYLAGRAVLRAANLAPTTSSTIPLAISALVLIGCKAYSKLDLDSVERAATQPLDDREAPAPPGAPADGTVALPDDEPGGPAAALAGPQTAAAWLIAGLTPEHIQAAREQREARLAPGETAVAERKQHVARRLRAVFAVAVVLLAAGMGALGSSLVGGPGLNDGRHDPLLTSAGAVMSASLLLLNVWAALALSYAMHVPGAAVYRSAQRDRRLTGLRMLVFAVLARPERRRRHLVEALASGADHAELRADLGALADAPSSASPAVAASLDHRLEEACGGDRTARAWTAARNRLEPEDGRL